MSIKRLSISHVRNLQNVDIDPHPSLNLFFGVNGAGKTSILESVNLISVGRSFRHHRPKPIINYQSQALTVFALVGRSDGAVKRLGLSKTSRGETRIHIDGQAVYSAAHLAEASPVLNLNAQSFELIGGPPKPRRQLLDWLTFHVEPLFLPAWKSLQHCLKQRNNLLRHDKINGFELDSWDSQLTELTAKIHSFRSRAFGLYSAALGELGPLLPDVGEVTISYKKGWPLDENFAETLARQRSSDGERGYTQSGPHRADLAIRVDDHNAADSLSRGQAKIVVTALIVGLAKAYKDTVKKGCALLVDDLPSELDRGHRQRIGVWLSELQSQLFVTAVDRASLVEMWPEKFVEAAKLFHVKQGQVENCDQALPIGAP